MWEGTAESGGYVVLMNMGQSIIKGEKFEEKGLKSILCSTSNEIFVIIIMRFFDIRLYLYHDKITIHRSKPGILNKLQD